VHLLRVTRNNDRLRRRRRRLRRKNVFHSKTEVVVGNMHTLYYYYLFVIIQRHLPVDVRIRRAVFERDAVYFMHAHFPTRFQRNPAVITRSPDVQCRPSGQTGQFATVAWVIIVFGKRRIPRETFAKRRHS